MSLYEEVVPVKRSLLISAKEFATLLSISIRTLWRLRSAGKLPTPVEIGSSIRWNADEVRRWISDGCPDRSAKRR
jgi:predicted DNA-binding transcriptional regulator AlpA